MVVRPALECLAACYFSEPCREGGGLSSHPRASTTEKNLRQPINSVGFCARPNLVGVFGEYPQPQTRVAEECPD